jgi:hypothetical protein
MSFNYLLSLPPTLLQAKIRQILDHKEQIALDTVENEMKRRLSVLTGLSLSISSVLIS